MEAKTPDAGGLCSQCGARPDTGLIFCRTCGAPLRPPAPLLESSLDDVKPSSVTPLKQVVVTVVKGIAGIALVVALFCPLGSWTQILTFVGSVATLLICHSLLMNLDDNYTDEYPNDGYWPKKPTDWRPRRDRHDVGKEQQKG